MDIQAVRTGLAANVNTIPGLTCYGFVPDSVSEPCFMVGEVDITYDLTFRGMDELIVTCRLLVSRADDAASQKALNAYLGRGAKSVKRAIEDEETLGGACDDVRVQRVQGYRFYQHGSNTYVGAEFIVQVIGDPEPEE
jgi:hypothetical protein